jgi:urease accessory protein
VNLRSSKRCGAAWWTGVGFFLLPIPASHAHLTVQGVGDVANGALHPLMTPAHLLVILSLGLLLGQRVPLRLKTPFRIFAPVSAAALLLTLGGWVDQVGEPVLISIALVTAALVALEMNQPAWLGGLLCTAAAAAIGLDSTVDGGSTVSVLKTLAGTWLGLNAAVFYTAVCASNAEGRKWARTGIRVLGSWIIAIALMVLAFSLRKSS